MFNSNKKMEMFFDKNKLNLQKLGKLHQRCEEFHNLGSAGKQIV